MKLINTPEAPPKGKILNRILFILFALIAVINFAGCDKKLTLTNQSPTQQLNRFEQVDKVNQSSEQQLSLSQIHNSQQVLNSPASQQVKQQNNNLPLKPNEFKVESLKVGTTVNNLKVASIKPYSTEQWDKNGAFPVGINNSNYVVQFKGQLKLHGHFHNYVNEPFVLDGVCFDEIDKKSLEKIPRNEGRKEISFCFSNKDFAKKQFAPPGSNGEATIIIDEYTDVGYEAEVTNLAKLVKVINKS